jgi:PPIC-type PPIASE domain
MFVRRSTLLFAAFPLLLASCSDPPEPAFTVAGIPVQESTVSGLREPERQAFIDLLAFGALVARGRTAELVEPIARRETEGALISALPVHLGARSLQLSEEALRTAYAASPEWELVVRHVVRLVEAGDPPAARDSARAIAREVAAAAAGGEDFATLAGRFSEEPGAARRGGLLEPGRRGSWVDAFWNAAAGLQPGQVSAAIETEYGYHVLKLEDQRPVPFEEADRTELLRRVVPPDTAAAAMERWASTSGAVLLDPPSVGEARNLILSGAAVPDSLVIARGAAGGEYVGSELAAAWARLPPDQREVLTSANELAFAAWVEEDARGKIWADLAREEGIVSPGTAEAASRAAWLGRGMTWAAAFGFEPGMTDERVLAAVPPALLSGSPEPRAARAELRGLRPLLRAFYPLEAREP